MGIKRFLVKQYARLYPPEMFVGITGSVGKTTCALACSGVLSQKYKTLNTNLDIPSTILKINPTIQKVILEMGITHKGEMDSYLSIIRPKVAIVTKIAYAHSASLGDLDEILEEKGKLIESLDKNGVAVLNYDDINCRKLAEKCQGSVVYFGTDPENCTVWADNIKIENFATTFELNYKVERVKINFKLLGLHQVYPALAAAQLGIISGIPLTKIKLSLESVEPLDHCLQAIAGPNGSVLLDDSFSSSPADLDAAIDTLLAIPARRRVVVLGDMKELGQYSEKLHRQVAQKIYKEKLDFVFLGAGEIEVLADELRSLGFWEERLESGLQNSQIVSKLLKNLGKGDICLIKGARVARLDEVVKRITKKV